MRSPKLWTAVLVLGALHLALVFARFVAPYDPVEQHRRFPFAPPSRVHVVDTGGRLQWPFVYRWIARPGAFNEYEEDTTRRFPIRLLPRGAPYTLMGIMATDRHLVGVDAPARIFLAGTDAYGRDVLSRLVCGGQISLLAGSLAALLALGLGLLFGSVSGFFGGWIDDIVMRVAELFLGLPWLYLLLGVRGFLPLHLTPQESFLLVVGVIGVIGWARPARIVRGIVLSARERKYVLAGRGFGATNFYLFRRHVFPQTIGVLLTQAAILIPHYILAEVALSFFGLGIGEPVPSWGNMVGSLQQYHVLMSYWWMSLPAFTLVAVAATYHVLASAAQETRRPVAL
ncbi:MAG: ABC transporter permease [Acidobacteria bacterium]|nr:ABC transporter permease [Acidobacteriota bacterium]